MIGGQTREPLKEWRASSDPSLAEQQLSRQDVIVMGSTNKAGMR